MSRYHSYLNNAVKIINEYKMGSPLSIQLKDFFSKEKKIGSKDRKAISGMCYQYFRCFHLLKKQTIPIEEAIVQSVWICSSQPSDFLNTLAPEWNHYVQASIQEKLQRLGLDSVDLFEYNNLISDTLDKAAFAFSLYNQASVFLRIRPQKYDTVVRALESSKIDFAIIDNQSIEIKNNASVDQYISLNRDAVIQDLSSQKVFSYLKADVVESKSPLHVWDVCAASGGKSILLSDVLLKKVNITVSDIREKMLYNLKRRFQEARIPLHHLFTQDVTKKSGLESENLFDIIICDVPCSGSGTWSRTPEQYKSFDPLSLLTFNNTQRQVVQNVIPHLKKDGLLFYITCSVFKAENENIVNDIVVRNKLDLLDSHYIRGYEKKADTMFVAVMKNSFKVE